MYIYIYMYIYICIYIIHAYVYIYICLYEYIFTLHVKHKIIDKKTDKQNCTITRYHYTVKYLGV